jgi:phosphatidylglycerol lysyltransferase
MSPQPPDATRDRLRALEVLKRHGWNATSFQILEPGLAYWFDGDEACVGYLDTGSAWVAAGAPIAAPDRLAQVAERFVAAARRAGRRCCFFATEARFADAAPGFRSLTIGEQPTWDPGEWEATLRQTRSLREQIRRARAKGVAVRPVAAAELADPASPTRRGVDAVIGRWLGARAMAPMGFLVQVDPFSFPEERRYFVAEVAAAGGDKRVVAFLAAVPIFARGGWFLEDLLRDPAAPNGTAELLVDAAMRRAAAEGSRYLTLGLAPLAGEVHGLLRAARGASSALYDFEGIHAFKAKLRPRAWDPIYLSYPDRGGGRAMLDSLVAFSRGGLLRFGLETLLRGPALVVRLLALLLLPWTVLLALPASRAWFPAAWVQLGWVGFDLALAGSLIYLTVRWRQPLATTLAIAVTADAAVTLAEAALWNLPRVARVFDLLVIAAAVLAPTVAAFLLWRARAHRARWS